MPVTGMPISERIAARPDREAGYEEALDAFLAAHVQPGGGKDVVAIYRAVQAMPYFSGPDRTPQAALRDGRGACTAKHLVLRDLLRRLGLTAEVEVVEGDFASGIPVHPTMPAALTDMILEGGVTDFHCRVRLSGPEGNRYLDATWPLDLMAWGFPADRDWAGQGDTCQAIAEVTVMSSEEDTLGVKAGLLATLPEAALQRRERFLALLSDWLAALPQTANEDR